MKTWFAPPGWPAFMNLPLEQRQLLWRATFRRFWKTGTFWLIALTHAVVLGAGISIADTLWSTSWTLQLLASGLLGGAVAVGTIFAARYYLSQSILAALRGAGYCTTCGYNLTGNVSGKCPECGRSVPGSDSALF